LLLLGDSAINTEELAISSVTLGSSGQTYNFTSQSYDRLIMVTWNTSSSGRTMTGQILTGEGFISDRFTIEIANGGARTNYCILIYLKADSTASITYNTQTGHAYDGVVIQTIRLN
jgi:hypothetical protein